MNDKPHKVIPELVKQLCWTFEAWIVGSGAEKNNTNPRDWDVVVPFYNWGKACLIIPTYKAKINNFGGIKVTDENGIEIDIWPGDLGWLARQKRFKCAWYPPDDIRIVKND